MDHHIIFVGGVHGVGKTNLSQRIAQHLAIPHITASTLIRQAGQLVVPEQKQVATVADNQDVLVRALQYYQSPTTAFLLDGHFCLLNTHSHIQPIPLDTFKQIAPKAVIVVVDTPGAIAERIAARDKVAPNRSLIAEFQSRELAHAQFVCSNLMIPLRIHNFNDNLDVLLNFIKDTLA